MSRAWWYKLMAWWWARKLKPAVWSVRYAGEDDDLGGSKPSDPDDGASDDE